MTKLVSHLDDAVLREPVPATPEWSMTDVIAHLAGILADIRAGNLEGVATDPWTAKQVEARRGRKIPQLL
ncbi:MAG: maleylpyruvate isomerase N-terminal domain-containing protein, partial [Actinomycetota bacterium]